MQPFVLDLTLHPDAKRYVSRRVPMRVTFATTAGTVITLEGPVSYDAGDAIVTGLHGEQWPIPNKKFESRYEPTGTPDYYVKLEQNILALRQSAPFQIRLMSGDVLSGQAGDWLVQYAPHDHAIVAADLFDALYKLVRG